MVSLLRSASIRAGRSAAFVLPLMAALCFGTEGRAQTSNIYFQRAPLSVSPDTLASPGLPSAVENYSVDGRSWTSGLTPKFDLGNSVPWKEYPALTKDGADDSFGRVPLNGGSFGIEAEQRLDLKKIAPSNEYVESNIERHAKKPFVGFSIVAPYNSE